MQGWKSVNVIVYKIIFFYYGKLLSHSQDIFPETLSLLCLDTGFALICFAKCLKSLKSVKWKCQ